MKKNLINTGWKWGIAWLVIMLLLMRLVCLDSIPSILNPDEASIGYNAYLLAETGRDEWDRPWPVVLEAFGDQKVIGYTLLVVPLIKMFGMEDWAVRLPAALASVGVAVVTAWLVWRWKSDKWLAGLSLVIIGLQPVFIWYGRSAFEAVVALFYTIGLLALLLEKGHVSWGRWTGIVMFVVAACFTYNTPLLLVPALLLIVPAWHGWRKWREWLPKVVVGLVMWLICIATSLSLTSQKSQITLFGDETTIIAYGEYRDQFTGWSLKLVGNRYVYLGREISERFIHSFAPDFLLANKDGHPWHALPGYGYLTVSVYILGWLGMLIILCRFWQHRRQLSQMKAELLLLYLTVMSVVPASITVNAPHATHSLLFFVGWSILAAVGSTYVVKVGQKYLSKPLMAAAVVLLILVPSGRFLTDLYWKYPDDVTLQAPLQPGFAEVIQQLESKPDSEQVAVVEGRGFHYILAAWYARLTPVEFRSTIVKQLPDRINFKYGERVGRYRFVANSADQQDEVYLVEWNEVTRAWEVTPSL